MTVAKAESARWVEGQLGLAAATADGIPTLIGNANRKKSSTHSGNQNFFCAANKKKRAMMCSRKLNSLTKKCCQKKKPMKPTDVVSLHVQAGFR